MLYSSLVSLATVSNCSSVEMKSHCVVCKYQRLSELFLCVLAADLQNLTALHKCIVHSKAVSAGSTLDDAIDA